MYKTLPPEALITLISVGVGVIGYFLSRMIKTFDASTHAQHQLAQELTFLKANMHFMHSGIHEIPKMREDIAVLKRDLVTAWKHIDSLETKLTKNP